jgi:hypothetical protein
MQAIAIQKQGKNLVVEASLKRQYAVDQDKHLIDIETGDPISTELRQNPLIGRIAKIW